MSELRMKNGMTVEEYRNRLCYIAAGTLAFILTVAVIAIETL